MDETTTDWACGAASLWFAGARQAKQRAAHDMADRAGEKTGWIGGWLGGFVWVIILSTIMFVQGKVIQGILGLGLAGLAGTMAMPERLLKSVATVTGWRELGYQS